MSYDDFAFEPIPGIPDELPPGEVMLWQGKPDTMSFALRAFHVRTVAIYFAGLMAIWAAMMLLDGFSIGQAFAAALSLLPFLIAAALLQSVLGWAYARTTIYSMTNKRLIMRSGIALPTTINLPFAKIKNAGLRSFRDNTGDIPIELAGEDQFSFVHLWPNVRPWRISTPQAMLRSLPNAAEFSAKFADTLRIYNATHGIAAAVAGEGADAASKLAPRIVSAKRRETQQHHAPAEAALAS